MIGATLRDLRYAARGLGRAPGFAAAAVLTLALGIGATTTVFSVVYGVLFRPLPFPNAERLVEVVQLLASRSAPNEAPSRAGLSVDQFIELQERSKTLIVGRYVPIPGTLTGIATPVRLNGARVSASLFASLGVDPLIGRTFSADEEAAAGADPVIVLSYRTWTQYFGRDAAILDQRITWNGTPHRVVGVMPSGFGFPSLASRFMSPNAAGELDDSPEFWLPAVPLTRLGPRSGFSLFPVLALLRDGVTLEQASAEVNSLLPPLPDGREPPSELVSARVEMTRDLRPVLAIFQIGVTLILLIAAVNVVNLLLARTFARERELAVRLALGASRARIAREAMAESVLLALSGGAIGCLFAYAFSGAVRSLPPHVLPRLREVQVDSAVLAFALAISVGTGLAVGLFSAFRATRWVRLAPDALRGGGANRRLRPSNVLVVAEIAATMVLLAGAGLMINSFVRLIRVNPGFDPKGVLTFRVALPADRYPTTESQEQFYRALAESMNALPGVESVGASNSTLQSPNIYYDPLSIGGQSVGEGDITIRQVTPDYFAALRIPLRQGRTFRDSDRAPVANRVVVNEAFVRKYVPAGDAVGRVIGFSDWPSLEVVGVVADAKEALDDQPAPTFYLPADEKLGFGGLVLFVRTSSAPLGLMQPARAVARRLDPLLALYDPMTLEQWLANSSASPRLYGLISFWSGAIALLLAGIGLYGVLAHSVSSRTREFGIRMALGARTERLIVGVVRQGLTLTVSGIVVGLAGAYYASRYLETLLFGLTPRDPGTFAMAALMFIGVAMVACYVPSRRATHVNPVVALRAE